MATSFAIRGRSSVMAFVLAVAAPTVVTLAALLPQRVGITTPALAYVLAVAGVAAYGGLRAGVAASLVSFAALHFFFTPPREVLALPGSQDLIALLVFLVVSSLIGAMLSAAVSRGSAAERKAGEIQVLHRVAGGLLSGEAIEDVLAAFARSVRDLLELARIEVSTTYAADRIVAGQEATAGAEGFPMHARGHTIGLLRAGPRDSGLGREEREALTMFADQLAIVLDSVGLAVQTRRAELEADESRARAAIFSSVTHDLRTPLASILASATTLRADGRLAPEDRRELLDTICDESARLNRLVGNLLDLSRMHAGSLTPAKVNMSITELLAGVLGRMEAALANHPVDVRVTDDLPEVPMDVVQMDQVLTNLLENAIRFAPAGSSIDLRAERSDGVVRLRVADRGPGVPPEEREHVFEPFVRVPDRQDGDGQAHPGAGLGLAICRAIVEAHEGTIRIDGTPVRGTTVVIELPLEER